MRRAIAIGLLSLGMMGTAMGAEYKGNPKSKVVHTEKDVHAKTCKACTVVFTSIAAAEAAGYRLCGMSAEGRAAKKKAGTK